MSRDKYSYNRYQKELAKKKKAEDKRQRKLEKKALEAASKTGPAPDDATVQE